MGKKEFLKSVIYNRNRLMYWSLVELVRPLKSSQKEALGKLLLCDDYNDLTTPTSNHIKYIHIAVSVVYGIFFEHSNSCSYCLILHFNCVIKYDALLL